MLRGEGVEQGDGELPYAPLLGALRPLVRARHPALERSAREAVRSSPRCCPGSTATEASAEQRRRLRAAATFRGAARAARPARARASRWLLILEDMHWADRSTRTFVAFLARSLRQERVMLLLTYRTDELHRRHALRPLLAELDRLERARRIELAPFDRDELAEALADILGDQPSARAGRAAVRAQRGQPPVHRGAARRRSRRTRRRAAELARRVPAADRAAARRRPARGAGARRRAARSMSRRSRRSPGSSASGCTGRCARRSPSRCWSPARTDGCRSATRCCARRVYDDLLPGERGELHFALARALEAQCADDEDREAELAATIAGHYAAAGDQPAALRAAVRAALAAREVHAYGEAADLAERALELWPRVPEPEQLTSLDHVDLLALAAGGARHRRRTQRAPRCCWRTALHELDPAADPRRYSSLLARLARVQWSLNRGPEGIDTAQRALSMLPEGDDESRASAAARVAGAHAAPAWSLSRFGARG